MLGGVEDRAEDQPSERTSRPSGRLVLVSNRLPVRLTPDGRGGLALTRTTGGLATGLAVPHRNTEGIWIGWSGRVTEGGEVDEATRALLAAEGLHPIGLDEDEHERFYVHTSNRCLWPLLHGFVERMQYDRADWEVYRRVNRRFADAVIQSAAPDDLVFVQDFHLMLVPSMVRAARPELRIGFFLHVPFPHTGIFRVLPTRAEVLEGMLGADFIGFHTLEYLRSFRSTARRVLGAETTTSAVEHAGRLVQLTAEPLGLDPAPWDVPNDDPDVAAAMVELRDAAAGRRVILGVERLDYTKGIPERLRAFRELLAEDPARAKDIVFFQIAVPSRTEVDEYRELKEEVEQLAGEINGRFGRVGLQPLHYQFRGVDRARLVALYRCADVCLVTPLRDGLNLVAKEFVASRRDDDGVLVLSEFAGAAWELAEALQVNPYDIDGVKDALCTALAMSPEEQHRRMAPMRARLRRHDVHRWTAACLAGIRGGGAIAQPQTLENGCEQALRDRWRGAHDRVVALDYDGTLRELEATPEDAAPTDAVLDLLQRLVATAGVEPWIVSGRDAAFLARHLRDIEIGLIVEHGRCARFPGEREFRALLPSPPSGWKERVRPLLEAVTDRVPGSLLEEKPQGLAWHYRRAERESGAWQAHELYLHLGEVLADEPLEVLRGSRVLEIRPAGITKARGLQHVLSERRAAPDLVVIAGDDVTDESLFLGFPDALSILIGSRPSAARYRVGSPAHLRALLNDWLATIA